MIVDLKDLSKDELIEMNKRAIAQISKLIDEKQQLKQKLEQELKNIKAKGDTNLK